MRHTVDVTLPDGFRWAVESDLEVDFNTGHPLIDSAHRLHLRANLHLGTGLTLVHEIAEEMMACAHLSAERNVLTIELLAKRTGAPRGLGAALVGVVESYVAPRLGIKELRLDAWSQRLAAYYERLGFSRVGGIIDDPEWGVLVPMRKALR